jgi:hypothetical protein
MAAVRAIAITTKADDHRPVQRTFLVSCYMSSRHGRELMTPQLFPGSSRMLWRAALARSFLRAGAIVWRRGGRRDVDFKEAAKTRRFSGECQWKKIKKQNGTPIANTEDPMSLITWPSGSMRTKIAASRTSGRPDCWCVTTGILDGGSDHEADPNLSTGRCASWRLPLQINRLFNARAHEGVSCARPRKQKQRHSAASKLSARLQEVATKLPRIEPWTVTTPGNVKPSLAALQR